MTQQAVSGSAQGEAMHGDGRTRRSVAIVIVNYRTPELALQALEAIADERHGSEDIRAIIVDGGSGDESAEIIAEGLKTPRLQDWVELLALPINGGFGWANNQAMLRLLQGDNPPEFIHLLNPDTIVQPGAIHELVEEMQLHPDCAAVGSLLLEMDGTPSGSAFRFPSIAGEFSRALRIGAVTRMLGIKPGLISSEDPCDAEWVTGASVLLRVNALREVGLFDDGFFLYFEEVELMWRLRQAGWSIRHQPRSRLLHVGGAATGVYVRDGKERKLPRRPAYWYQSRRRFFARTQGRGGAALATIAWLAAAPVGFLRARLSPEQTERPVEKELIDLVRLTLVPRAPDGRGAVVKPETQPGTSPAWMDKV